MKSDEELTAEQYHVMRERGTEPPFSGEHVYTKEDGVYRCAACDQELFSSEDKYDSGTGWPSFTDPVNPANVLVQEDRSHGMVRTEAVCSRCGAHLGHVFGDGPGASGQRWCINSVSLDLDKAPEE